MIFCIYSSFIKVIIKMMLLVLLYIVQRITCGPSLPLNDYYYALNYLDSGDNTANVFCLVLPQNVEVNLVPTTLTAATTYISMWIKPPGFMKIYQGQNSFQFLGNTITYGTLGVSTSSSTLASSENWLNLIFKIKIDGTNDCVIDKFYIRKIEDSEVWVNPSAKEFFHYLVDYGTGATKLNEAAVPYKFPRTITSTGQVFLGQDPELRYFKTLGRKFNVFATVFEGDLDLEAESGSDQELFYKMIILGRPKPLVIIPTFQFFTFALSYFQDEPYNIQNYIDQVYSVDLFGYNVYPTSTVKMQNLLYNYYGFNCLMTFELKVYMIPFDDPNKEVRIQILVYDSNSDSPDNVINNVEIRIKKTSATDQTLTFELFSLVDNRRFISYTMPFDTQFSQDLSLVYMEGFGLLYSDNKKAITERLISLSSSDGFSVDYNNGYFIEQLEKYNFHYMGSNQSMVANFSTQCIGCSPGVDEFIVRLLNYQLLLGVFSPSYLIPWIQTSLQYISPDVTVICALVLNNGNYIIQVSSSLSPDITKLYCSRPFMYPNIGTTSYFSDSAGKLQTPTVSNCLVEGNGQCLVCSNFYINEFSGFDQSSTDQCFYESSCNQIDMNDPYSYTRYLSTVTLSTGVQKKICHNRLEGCQASTFPLQCDMCQKYKKNFFNNYTCQCAVDNCEQNSCEDSPCSMCQSGYDAIFIDKATDMYRCVKNNGCNGTYGADPSPMINSSPVSPGTTWCRECQDSNCADCMANYMVCSKCKDRHFLNSSNICTTCDANCLTCGDILDSCLTCDEGKVLIQKEGKGYCADILTMNRSYFVVSVSTAYIKFNDVLNSNLKIDNYEGFMFESKAQYDEYKANPSSFQSSPIKLTIKSFKVSFSHLIVELQIDTTSVNNGVFIMKVKDKQLLNNTSQTKFYSEELVVVDEIDYFRAGSSIEYLIGLFFGIILGITGILALFIPAVKYTTMCMKIFQMNNYFFLLNINLPYNLYLFFQNIQFGNFVNLLVLVNPVSFLTNKECREFEDKLLTLNKTCQIFANAGPHFLWFGLSGIIKLVLELYQLSREKAGEKRGKLYEFLKLKFGRRYFIELLNFFHMDLVLYNLMNLMFTEINGFISFLNLFVSVIFMVFFIYFYISLFVIIAENTKDFLLNNLCDPEGNLNKITASDTRKVKPFSSGSKNNMSSINMKGKVANKPVDLIINSKPKNPNDPNESKEKWSIMKVYEQLKAEKEKEKEELDDSAIALEKKPTQTNDQVAQVQEAPTYLPSSIYRFLFINSHCMNTYSKHYYAIGLIKEFTLAMVLVLASDSGIVQIMIFFIVFIAIFYFNLTKAPLQNTNNNKILRFYSLTYVFMSLMTVILAITGSTVSPRVMHYFFGYVLMLMEIIIICLMVAMVILEFLKKRKDKKELLKQQEDLKRIGTRINGPEDKVADNEQSQNDLDGIMMMGNHQISKRNRSRNTLKHGEEEGAEEGMEEDGEEEEELEGMEEDNRNEGQGTENKDQLGNSKSKKKKKGKNNEEISISNDSFKEIELGVMKGRKMEGGVYFQNKYSENSIKNQEGESQMNPSQSSSNASKSKPIKIRGSIASQQSSEMKRRQLIKSKEANNDLKRVMPKRVESQSDNISIDMDNSERISSDVKPKKDDSPWPNKPKKNTSKNNKGE